MPRESRSSRWAGVCIEGQTLIAPKSPIQVGELVWVADRSDCKDEMAVGLERDDRHGLAHEVNNDAGLIVHVDCVEHRG